MKINDIIKEAPPSAVPAQAAALKQRRQAMPQNTTVQAQPSASPAAAQQQPQQPPAAAPQQPQQPQATGSYNAGNKLGQMAGKAVAGVKQAVGAVAQSTPVLVAKQIAKQAAPGMAQALKSQTGGSDPMGLGGFQAVSAAPITNPAVAVMDPETKKPVTYTKYGQDWMGADGNGVIDPAMISHLDQQLKANRARASGE